VLIAVGFAVAYQFVDPAPPRHLTLATGSPDGAYHAFGERYKAILARDGITVRLVESAGSVENLALLEGPAEATTESAAQPVDMAFVQSGIGDPAESPGLVALASLYYEPLWIFVRGAQPVGRLTALAGKRITVGAAGSGTRAVALELLAANGISAGDAEGTVLSDSAGAAAAEALAAGKLDAAFFVTAKYHPLLSGLLAQPDIDLLSLERAAAYQRRYRYLAGVTLPEGAMDLAANLPAEDVQLLSPLATLVAREGVHPALMDLMLRAATEIHGGSGLFEEPGEFPSPHNVDFPLSPSAERYFQSGLPFLRRVLPFWAATLVERLWVLLLPALTLLIPLLRIAPPTYRWQVRRRITRWYRDLRRLESDLQAAAEAGDRDALQAALGDVDRLQVEIGGIAVPLSYASDLYNLRLHAEFVRRRFALEGPGG
jgi:TRAP transporter TAXI family solute receptor